LICVLKLLTKLSVIKIKIVTSLLQFTDKGIYCAQADVYIDPWQPVGKAIITHAHADHARFGHKHYLCHRISKPVLQYRLGQDCNIQSVEYEEQVTINGVTFSLHPAGHIPGSAQIRVAFKDEVWVVTGDYKLEYDGISTSYEPVKCHTFITECTFGLPVYRWPDPKAVNADINSWWKCCAENRVTPVLIGYSLGKAQRLIHGLDKSFGTVYTHGAVENMNEALRYAGVSVGDTVKVTPEISREAFKDGIVVAPPSALGTSWMNKFRPFSVAIASGWMALRGTRRRRAVDRGFVVSDHADWKGLNEAVKLSGAERVITTHGYTDIFTKWLQDNRINAMAESTQFEGELSEISEAVNIDG